MVNMGVIFGNPLGSSIETGELADGAVTNTKIQTIFPTNFTDSLSSGSKHYLEPGGWHTIVSASPGNSGTIFEPVIKGNNYTLEFITKFLNVNHVHVGIGDAVTPTEAVDIGADGTNGVARTITASTVTSTSFTYKSSYGTQAKAKIIRTATDVKFYLDDVLVATHTTNIPTTELKLYITNGWVGGSPTASVGYYWIN